MRPCMDPTSRTGSPSRPDANGGAPVREEASERSEINIQTTPALYYRCDVATEVLLYAIVVYSAWAFGVASDSSILTMNFGCLGLGALWGVKLWIRWRWGYRPPRWGEEVPVRGKTTLFRPPTRLARWMTRALAALTIFVLLYCFVAAVNARATFVRRAQVFNPSFVSWLPHSYSAGATWLAFRNYLCLAVGFWAIRDWLLGKNEREATYEQGGFLDPLGSDRLPLPERLYRLFWVLCANGTLLAVVSIVQRVEGTDRLLWLVKPTYGTAEFHFGPFGYRGNAAQYFNLLWPVSLAFWWTLYRHSRALRRADARVGAEPHIVLLPCVLVQVACPVISASHGGAVVAAVLAVGALGILMAANWKAPPAVRTVMMVPFLAGLTLAVILGRNQFDQGLTNAFMDDLGDRVEIYQNAAQMAVDHPVFGMGPGTFGDMYLLYRSSERNVWAVFAHNDWLETLITFGWVGFSAVLLMLAHVFVRWWVRDGLPCRWDLMAMIWLALGGVLFHARFDFPLQTYPLLFLFLLLSSVACCAAREH